MARAIAMSVRVGLTAIGKVSCRTGVARILTLRMQTIEKT